MAFNYYEQVVVDLFIAAYGRAPTQTGLDFFAFKMQNDGWSDRDIANYMFDVNNNPEAVKRYPNSASLEDKVNAIFNHVLGRAVATQQGMDFWKNKLANPNYTLADVVLEVIKSAKEHSKDAQTLQYKSDAVEYFLNKVPLVNQPGQQINTDGIHTYNDLQAIKEYIDFESVSSINDSYDLVDYSSIKEIKALDSMQNWKDHTITYSFNTYVPTSYYNLDSNGKNHTKGFVPFTDEEKGVVRDTFKYLEKYINLDFQEVSDNGDIRFSNVDTDNKNTFVYGYAYGPNNGEYSGEAFLSNKFFTNNNFSFSLDYGEYGRAIINEVIGYSLGLKNPMVGNNALPNYEANGAYSIMTDNFTKDLLLSFPYFNGSITFKGKYINPSYYSLYDIETLQAKYGVNDSINKGNNSYFLNFDSGYNTIWDSGGEDTLDLSTTTGADIIDLSGGTLNSVDMHTLDELIKYYQDKANDPKNNTWIANEVTRVYNSEHLYDGTNNLGIAKGTIIENIITGSGNDKIFDNYVNNIIITGRGDDNIYIGSGGLDTINGGDGTDYLHIISLVNDITIKHNGNKYHILDETNGYGAIVENVEFLVDAVGVVYDIDSVAQI